MADNEQPRLPANAGRPIGKSGTLIFKGHITSEDYNRELTGAQLIKKVEIMRRSNSTIRAALLIIKLPILGADWHLRPASDPDGKISDFDREVRDFTDHELFHGNISFFDTLKNALTMEDFGYAVGEKTLRYTEYNGKPRIGIDEISFRKQSTIYAWETSDGKPGITQLINNGETFDIPMEKLVIFTNDKEGDNYEGVSVLRYAYMDWDMLDKLKIGQAVKLDRISAGIPYAEARDGMDPGAKDLEKAEEIMRNIRLNEEAFIVAPSTISISMMDMKASSTEDILPFLNYLDSRISKSVLAGFMEIGGQSGSGAQSLAENLTSFFFKAEEAIAKTIQSTIQEQIIKPLIDLNWKKEELVNGYPQLEFGQIADDDLTALATAIGTLAEKKLVTPDLELEDHLRKQYKLPAMSDEAKEQYKEARQLGIDGMKAENEAKANPAATNVTEQDAAKLKEQKQKAQASLEAAREEARKSRHVLIDAITG